MDNIRHVVIEINDNYKKIYLDWIKSNGKKIPTINFNLEVEKGEIIPNTKYIWFYIMEFIEDEINNILVHKYNNIIDKNDYHRFVINNFNNIKNVVLIPVLTNIKSLKSNFSVFDMDKIKNLLNDYSRDRILILTMLKKIMGHKLYKLCFYSLTMNDLLKISFYDLTNILFYYDYTRLSYKELKQLDENLPDIDFQYTWKHYKNIYIYMERYNNIVRMLNVEDILNYKSFNIVEHDNNILIITSDYICNKNIESLDELNDYLIEYMLKSFEPVTNLEKMVLGTVNKYVIKHDTSLCTYWRILKMVKNIFRFHLWNKSHKILKYSLANPKNKKKLYMKQIEYNNYSK
jgi:hypothetical protein